MCEPTTLAIAGLAATAISTGAGIVGNISAGNQAQQQAAYQAGVARNNQILAERAAQDALARGKIEEGQARDKTRQLIGLQRAALAGNGVLIDTGSALNITADTAGIGELDALTIRSNAEREASGYRAQGMNYEAEAAMLRASGKSSKTDSLWQAGSTALTGLGSVATKWYDASASGAFGGKPKYKPQNSLGGAPGQY